MGKEKADSIETAALKRFKAEAWPLLPSLARVATMLTRDEHQADDLVQETMLRAFRHIESFKQGTNMKAWLMTILRRTNIDLYRREMRLTETASLDGIGHDPVDSSGDASIAEATWDHPDELMDRFDDDAIERALRSLPRDMRWVLLLVDVERLSVADAAAALDIPPGTVKSRASRARKKLRESLLPLARQRGWVTGTIGE